MIRTAFLPSAGLGTRLRPLTDETPKPLLPVLGDPLIVHAMRHCEAVGIERFIVNTHHLPERFAEAFPGRMWNGIPIDFIHEPVRLETGTGLRNAFETLRLDEPLLVYNSDILTVLPLNRLLASHDNHPGSLATLAVSSHGPQLHVEADSAGRLTGVRRQQAEEAPGRFQYLGISVVEPGLVQHISAHEPESLVHAWTRAIADDASAIRIAEMTAGKWADAGTAEQYEALRENGLNAKFGVLDLAE